MVVLVQSPDFNEMSMHRMIWISSFTHTTFTFFSRFFWGKFYQFTWLRRKMHKIREITKWKSTNMLDKRHICFDAYSAICKPVLGYWTKPTSRHSWSNWPNVVVYVLTDDVLENKKRSNIHWTIASQYWVFFACCGEKFPKIQLHSINKLLIFATSTGKNVNDHINYIHKINVDSKLMRATRFQLA